MVEPQNPSVSISNEAHEARAGPPLPECRRDKLEGTTKKTLESTSKTMIRDLPIRTHGVAPQAGGSHARTARHPPVSKKMEEIRMVRFAENQCLRAESVLRLRATLKRDKAKMSSEPDGKDTLSRTSQWNSAMPSTSPTIASSTIASSPSAFDRQHPDLTSETHLSDYDFDETHDVLTNEKANQGFMINVIKQMMFVSGETAEPSIETTTLIEDITRQQVLEIVSLLLPQSCSYIELTLSQLTRSTQLATRRGSRSISTDDLIFLIRHDKAKVSRLRTFLSWKDVRKNVKDSDDKGGADAADFAGADDAAGIAAGPQDVAAKPKNKRAKVGLAWDVHSFFSVQIPERDDEEDEEEEEQNYATLQRLAAADERTKHMTKEEYVFWSECRQASFTYRKSKRFREWAGFGIVTESKPNDDIVDILGFLTFEIVQTLTEEALKVKEREDHEKNRGGADSTGDNAKKRKRETGLFDPPEEGRTPIEPRHIREAYRKLQATPQKAVAMLLHSGQVPSRLPLRLVSISSHFLLRYRITLD